MGENKKIDQKNNCLSAGCECDQELNNKEFKNYNDTSEIPNNKLLVDIYLPMSECACLWDKFINQIFEVITPYIKYISFKTKDIYSEEGRALNLMNNCVIINKGERRFTSAFTLKQELPKILHEKGLL